MKKRRIVVVALMLVAVICVGVGYAALQDTINFTGNISYSSTFDLIFTDVIGGTNQANVTERSVTNGDLTVEINADQMSPSSTISFTAQVKNNSLYKAGNFNVAIDGNASQYFTIEADVGDDTIAAGGTGTVNITITMNAYPIPEDDQNVAVETVTFSITGEQVDA